MRLWPLHSNEVGESAGEWWVSKYLFISKLAVRRDLASYRLDPFLFWWEKTPEQTSSGGLLGLAAYRRTRTDAGVEESWRALPLAYGYTRPSESGSGLFPLHYARDFGEKAIDYLVPWRFFFITNRLRGAGERHVDLLWKLAEYTDRPGKTYHDFRILQELVVDRRTETSREVAVSPLFRWFRDDAERRLDFSVLFSLYRYREVQGLPSHTLFWIFRW